MQAGPSRIALVSVWFGPLPFWFPALLASCLKNPDIDWLVFSDQPAPCDTPANVKFIPLDLSTFNDQASSALDYRIEVQKSYAYKLCDLKIMYGRIFERELHGYDFWGCCDIDVLWGDIRRFLSPALMARHDVITSRVGRISGHFCLFRNMPEWTSLYERLPRIRAFAEDNGKYWQIDEECLTRLLRGYSTSYWHRFKAIHLQKKTLPRVFWDKVWTTSGKHQRRLLDDEALKLRWVDGRAYDADGCEMMYLHFHSIRKYMKTINFGFQDRPKEIEITPNGIFAFK